jgi:hypothetical protein
MAIRACRAKLIGNVFGLVRLEIGNHDLGALATQAKGDGAANTLSAACHDCDFAVKSHV